ncbi:hypothetical protein [Pandoraea commovens]|uniref:Uncharacterized protein n=1 Tax=Pandoraea commovens TaxID=2508289 RepID=A0A5E4TQB4_9BURK|nr:hypothetical protein [Pandoraea commovens]UVA79585.1 hypothetical protein NTU39_00630 [Pandoraea commovens]VVD90025.1 hypothetical protein PCO31010_01595 [Pandoraea commovens]
MENVTSSGLSPIQPPCEPDAAQGPSFTRTGVAGDLARARQASSDAKLQPYASSLREPPILRDVDFSKIYDVWTEVSERPEQESTESQISELKGAIGVEIISSQNMNATAKAVMAELLWNIDKLPEHDRSRGLEMVLDAFDELLEKSWFDALILEVLADFDGPEWLGKFPESERKTVQLFLDAVKES